MLVGSNGEWSARFGPILIRPYYRDRGWGGDVGAMGGPVEQRDESGAVRHLPLPCDRTPYSHTIDRGERVRPGFRPFHHPIQWRGVPKTKEDRSGSLARQAVGASAGRWLQRRQS